MTLITDTHHKRFMLSAISIHRSLFSITGHYLSRKYNKIK